MRCARAKPVGAFVLVIRDLLPPGGVERQERAGRRPIDSGLPGLRHAEAATAAQAGGSPPHGRNVREDSGVPVACPNHRTGARPTIGMETAGVCTTDGSRRPRMLKQPGPPCLVRPFPPSVVRAQASVRTPPPFRLVSLNPGGARWRSCLTQGIRSIPSYRTRTRPRRRADEPGRWFPARAASARGGDRRARVYKTRIAGDLGPPRDPTVAGSRDAFIRTLPGA